MVAAHSMTWRRGAALLAATVVLVWLIGAVIAVATATIDVFSGTKGNQSRALQSQFECLRREIEALPKARTFIPLKGNGSAQRAGQVKVSSDRGA